MPKKNQGFIERIQIKPQFLLVLNKNQFNKNTGLCKLHTTVF